MDSPQIRSPRPKSRIGPLLLPLAIGLLFLASCRPSDQTKSETKPAGKDGKAAAKVEEAAIAVRVENPTLREMEEVIEVHGNLEPSDKIDVVAEISGTVAEVLVDAGDLVKKDDLLARVDDEEYQINLRQARTSYDVAAFDYQSSKVLFDEGMKSRSEFEKMKRGYLDAKSNLELYELRVKKAKVKAPIDGMVVTRTVEPHHEVGAMEVIFTVADLSSYEVPITVTEAEVAKIRVGQDVRVRIDALAPDPDSFPLVGKVKRIEPRVDPNTGSVKVEVELPDPGPGARMGMFTRLRIVASIHHDALVISRKAATGDNGDQVWVVEGQGARLIQIKTGLIDRQGIEVLDGLKPEDRVIVEGYIALTEKSKIEIVNPPASTPPPSPPTPGATPADPQAETKPERDDR